MRGEIEGAVADQIVAAAYVKDLYAGKLCVVGSPMTDAGLKLIALKDQHENLVRNFNKNLEAFKKKNKLKALLIKWQLA